MCAGFVLFLCPPLRCQCEAKARSTPCLGQGQVCPQRAGRQTAAPSQPPPPSPGPPWLAQIGGYCKPGFPGVIIAEGTPDAVQAYVAALRALRWSAMALRGSEPGGPARVLASPLREVPGEGMSELAAVCRAAGVEQLFLSALKLPGRSGGE